MKPKKPLKKTVKIGVKNRKKGPPKVRKPLKKEAKHKTLSKKSAVSNAKSANSKSGLKKGFSSVKKKTTNPKKIEHIIPNHHEISQLIKAILDLGQEYGRVINITFIKDQLNDTTYSQEALDFALNRMKNRGLVVQIDKDTIEITSGE
ncbi:MAG TPA: hypothetical protein PLX15_04355 [Candidatus Woesearchaeota archaeon]|nr:hypothetical protein [Candidatus Woesearchaeota archaeon]